MRYLFCFFTIFLLYIVYYRKKYLYVIDTDILYIYMYGCSLILYIYILIIYFRRYFF